MESQGTEKTQATRQRLDWSLLAKKCNQHSNRKEILDMASVAPYSSDYQSPLADLIDIELDDLIIRESTPGTLTTYPLAPSSIVDAASDSFCFFESSFQRTILDSWRIRLCSNTYDC
ncbi:MAG: hypothetical protein LVS60_02625 [Nodosilinea sp. LVE1205-7]